MRFIIADSFTKNLLSLDPSVQNLVKQSAFDFQTNPPNSGQSFHRLSKTKDKNFWSFRVNDDVRIIVYKQGADFILCYADHHDKAYQWARKRRLDIHPETGAAQMVEIHERVEEVTRHVIKEVEREAPLFTRYERDYLLALGVPVEWLDAVCHVGESGFFTLCEHLPQEAAERLMNLAAGEPVPRPVASAPTDPFSHPDAQRRFHIVNENQALLRRALESPWEQWLVFLHPAQRTLIDSSFRGSARVSGGAGTGKTVAALHRAAALARRDPEANVLLTTFSRTLAARLQHNLQLLMAEDAAMARIEVLNLHRLAVRLWQDLGERFNQLEPSQLKTRLKDAAAQLGENSFSLDFLLHEWAFVEAAGVSNFAAYRALSRKGRGTALGARQRLALWELFAQVQAQLAADGLMSYEGLCNALTQRLEASSNYPYQHVIADETQDFGAAELRLLRALVPYGEDDIFLAGDIGQRIYRTKSSFLAAGIDIRGRSSVLRLNYRTTEEIRRYADGLLPEVLEDADGLAESRRTVSLLRGLEPLIKGFADVQAEAQELAELLTACLRGGFRPGDIAVFARTRKLLEQRGEALVRQLGLPPMYLSNDIPPNHDSIALGTMHQAKGLEFKIVLVLGCEAGHIPLATALKYSVDPAQRQEREEAERNLLYVACTRARERLLLSYVGVPSPWLHEALA